MSALLVITTFNIRVGVIDDRFVFTGLKVVSDGDENEALLASETGRDLLVGGLYSTFTTSNTLSSLVDSITNLDS